MKNKKINNRTEKSFSYDSMLYRDIEMDLKKVKAQIREKTKLLKRKKRKVKKGNI